MVWVIFNCLHGRLLPYNVEGQVVVGGQANCLVCCRTQTVVEIKDY
jgi:hypothetical protein